VAVIRRRKQLPLWASSSGSAAFLSLFLVLSIDVVTHTSGHRPTDCSDWSDRSKLSTRPTQRLLRHCRLLRNITCGRFGIVTTGLRECRVGRPTYLIRRLPSVMNASVRMIHRLHSSDHITDALVNLHWHRVPERIQFKVAVLVYKVLHGLAPQYLGPLTPSPTYLVDVHSVRPARISWTYRLLDCRLSAVGHSTLLAREFGTVCQLM